MPKQFAKAGTLPGFQFEAAKWSIFAVLIGTYILVYFHRMAPGVVAELLMADFHTKGARLGSLAARRPTVAINMPESG